MQHGANGSGRAVTLHMQQHLDLKSVALEVQSIAWCFEITADEPYVIKILIHTSDTN